MNEIDLIGVPKVSCPREKKEVPVYYCLGSFAENLEPCPHCKGATVSPQKATVKCSFKKAKSRE